MIVVAPFCIKDCESIHKNITWSYELEGKLPYTVMLSYDSDVPPDWVDKIHSIAECAFEKVLLFKYGEWMGNPQWPNPQNYAFQKVCWEIINKYKEPFLFWEPDAVPIRKGWLTDLEKAYQNCGKAFLGHVVHGVMHSTSMHLNGVAIYPPNPHEYSVAMMIPPVGIAWDVAGSIDGVVQNARHTKLIMNVWEIDAKNRPCTHGGIVPSFPDQQTVDDVVDFDACLFHRNKDLSLVDRLRERLEATKPKPKLKKKATKRRMRRK